MIVFFEVSCHGKSVFLDKGDAILGASLNDGEIIISDQILNLLFPDMDASSVELPFEINFKRYEYLNEDGAILADYTFTVVGVSNGSATIFSESDYRKMKSIDIIPYAVYVENFNDANDLIDGMSERFFSWNSTEGAAVTLLNKSVNMFFDLFRLIEIMILAMTMVFLISHSVRSVKNNYYQIGVIKAIGGRSRDIAKIFVMQNALLSLIISALTYVGALIFVDVANDILVESFTKITNVRLGDISIISFNNSLVIAAIIATVVLSLVATVVPLILLHRIKPMNIIKAKE